MTRLRANGFHAAWLIGLLAMAASSPAQTTAPSTQPADFAVTVRDAKTHQPIAGAKVIFDTSAPTPEVNTQTDDTGRASFARPDAKLAVYVRVSADGHVPASLTLKAGEVPASYDIDLPPGVTVGGVVRGDDGQPVNGARVTLTSRLAGDRDRQGPRPALRTGVSYVEIKAAADGTWTYTGMPEAFTGATIGVTHPDYASHSKGGRGFYEMRDVDDRAGLLAKTFTSTLERGKTIRGTVVDEAGKPLAKVKVGLGTDRVASNMTPEAVADNDGHFTIHARPGEKITLTARVAKHAPQQATFTMPDGDHELTMTLVPARTLKGRVVDEQGRPVTNATLFVDGWRGTRTVSKRLGVDKDGQFTWDGAPDDEVTVDALADGYGDNRGLAMVWNRDNVVTMRRPLRVDGVVLDDETGKPVTEFTVVPGIDFGPQQNVHWQRQDYGAGDMANIRNAEGKFRREFTGSYPAMAVRIEAPGYKAAEQRNFRTDGGPQTATFRLKRGQALSAIVTDAAGQPLAGVMAALALPGQQLAVENGQFSRYDRDTIKAKTDAAGRFTLPAQDGAYRIVLIDDRGTADVGPEAIAAGKPIVLQPWGVVEGQVKIGSKPAGGATVDANVDEDLNGDYQKRPRVMYRSTTTADAGGAFRFARLPALKTFVGRRLQLSDNSYTWASNTTVTPSSEKPTTLTIGGTGRPVVGRLDLPDGMAGKWGGYHLSLRTNDNYPSLPYPDGWQTMDDAAREKWHKNWIASKAGKAFLAKAKAVEDARRYFPVLLKPDGSFQADDVAPGEYHLTVELNKPLPGDTCGIGDPMARGKVDVTVPDLPANQTVGEAVTVPPVALQMIKTLAVGEAAPDFSVPTTDGKTVSLGQYAGKYVLVDFWATWCGPCVASIPEVKALHDKYAGDERFVMISLSKDDKIETARTFAEKHGMTWTQGFLGQSGDKPSAAYGVDGIPSVWLIGPDGKVIAKDLRGPAVAEAVAKMLKR